MVWRKSLSKRLAAWIRDGGELRAALGPGDVEVRTAEEGRLVCAALDKALSVERSEQSEDRFNLYGVIALFQSVAAEPAFEVVRAQGVPRLRALVLRFLERRHVDADVILFALKQLATYGDEADVATIAAAARDAQCAKQWLWSMVFSQAARHDTFGVALMDVLRDPLPDGFCRMAYLDFSSRLAIAGRTTRHPFDTPAGHEAIRDWLQNTRAEEYSYAVSAAASLPFLSADAREPLLSLAQEHPDAAVRIEAAWAGARLGDESGFRQLVEFARDPRTADRAVRYLTELGAQARIPESSRDPDFAALAEMAQWLAHPNEFGRMPDHLEIAARRELHWPPTSDSRPLWVVRYEYRADDGSVDSGYGLVGSTTWAMLDHRTQAGTIEPLDVYAIHCCWELAAADDPRAPKEHSVAAGRRLLAERNPEFRLQRA
jgi:hypothetical protein